MRGHHSQVVQFLLSKGATVSTIYVCIMYCRAGIVINVNEAYTYVV